MTCLQECDCMMLLMEYSRRLYAALLQQQEGQACWTGMMMPEFYLPIIYSLLLC